MFVALNQEGAVINLLRENFSVKPAASYYCPSCKRQLVLKRGSIKITHFAHKKSSDCSGFSEGETKEHLAAKALIYTWDQQKCQLEAPLPDLNQRPDILWQERLAVEIQCSPLNSRRFNERVKGYHRAGYQQWWLVGSKYLKQQKLTAAGKKFCRFDQEIGFYFWHVHSRKRKILLYYQGHEICNQQWWSIKAFDWRRTDLVEIFSEPQQLKAFQFCQNPVQDAESYRNQLLRKLVQKNSKLLTIQAIFYKKGKHILELPGVLYSPSHFYFYFGDWILYFRYLIYKQFISNAHFETEFAKQIFTEQNFVHLSEAFPLIDPQEILDNFIVESRALLEKQLNQKNC